jgi:hypothetical protein
MVMSGANWVSSSVSTLAMPYTKIGRTGHCYLMMDNLQEAYTAYQQALYHLNDPKVSLMVVRHT